ncbi:MAG: type II secretion system protein [Verrucomicrobium sp.]|nr:type II secretion system protein [Verrucomicrobium sp.]
MRNRSSSGFTLVELAIGIALIVAMSMAGLGIGRYYRQYQNGLQCGAALKTIRQAQLAYLSDHPTETYANITFGNSTFLTYLPNGGDGLSDFQSTSCVYNGNQHVYLNPNVYPPTASLSPGGAALSTQTDGVWNSGP